MRQDTALRAAAEAPPARTLRTDLLLQDSFKLKHSFLPSAHLEASPSEYSTAVISNNCGSVYAVEVQSPADLEIWNNERIEDFEE
ncbi:hypothetical protein T07_15191 [Trichinella nelsoni]|uniref:Uncharacterized protein n=1 Tax=Trichinella nelsoni TaxID=6336 RepID=A0A0V0S011_9BILA|nr:hypothetical protein T07_15191 [Trichinella nelsoni]